MYATTNTSYSLKTDQDQALDHFKALGYEQGEKVYVRYIHPVSKKSIKATKLDFKSANRYQAQSYDVYFVVNGGGDTDSCVTQCRAIFYEHDNLDKSIQLKLWQNLGLPEPTIQVDTGGKSIHSYWVFDTPIATQQWRELETDLLEFSDGDRALKNPSRILRLAGSLYMKGNKPGSTRAVIVSNSGKRYSYEQLRAIIPIQQTPAPELQPIQQITPKTGSSVYTSTYLHFEDIQVPVPESVPLYNCLSKESRTLIEYGVSADRNVNGAKLARDLIGSANYLRSIGQVFDGDEWQLFTDYCHRCTPGSGWDESEMQSIWKSAQSSNPSPSCKPEGVETCVRAWFWNHYVKPNQFRSDHISNASAISNSKHSESISGIPHTVTAVSLSDRIIEILNRNHSTSERKAAFLELARSTGRQLREIEQLSEAIEFEVDLIDSRLDRTEQLESLRQISDRHLTISNYLHPHLAEPLERLAVRMGVDPEALLTVLMPTSASLLHPETRVIVKECIDFVEPIVFYGGIVSESGNRKSPTFKAITKVLRKLQDEEETRHKLAQEKYKADVLTWKRNKSEDKGEEPEPPRPPREYFVDNITSEALNLVKNQQPDHGLLIRKDELSGLIGSYGAYKGGRGSDKEGILSGWSGDGIKVNRASGSRLSLSHDASSIVGAIQPGKLRKLMGDLEDEQGEWGRFLWYFAPLRPFQLPEDDSRFEIGDLLEDIYRKLNNLVPVQYKFTSDGQQAYQSWHWELEQRKLKEPKQGMRAAIAKMQGYTARIAGILHILWATASGEVPEPCIPLPRVKAAQQLAEFYLGQVQLIHCDGEAAIGEFTPILAKILEKAQGLGSITARIVQQSIKALKNTNPQKIRDYFSELVAMELGVIEGQGNKVKFIPKTVDQTVNLSKKAETPDKSSLQSIAPQNCRPTVDQTVDPELIVEKLSGNKLEAFANKNCRPVDHIVGFSESNDLLGGEEEKLDGSGDFRFIDKSTVDEGLHSLQVYSYAGSLTESNFKTVDQESTDGSTVGALTSNEPFKVGDRVFWEGCPGHCAFLNPFNIQAIEGNFARLDCIVDLIPLTELRLLG